jgi:multiple sugar transport system substrate-binding protein
MSVKARRLLAVLLLMSLGGVAAGCTAPSRGGGETPPSGAGRDLYGDLEDLDPSRRVLVYWHAYTGSQEETLLAMIDDFNSTNEWGIVVLGQHVGSFDEVHGRIVNGIRSGRVPELSVVYRDQAAVYAARGAILDLTPYVESDIWGFSQEELDDFFPFVLRADRLHEFRGRYEFPLSQNMEVLYYNEDWLHELGYEHPPATWDEFADVACAAFDAEAGTYGYELSTAASSFANVLTNRGGRLFDAETGTYVFGNEQGLETLLFVQELLDQGCAVLETEPGGDTDDFAMGRVLLTIDRTTRLPDYRAAVAEGAGFNWSISTLPTSLDAPSVDTCRGSVSVFRTTPEKQLAAWLFIRWFTAPEQQARWARALGQFPVRASAADLLQDYLTQNPRYAMAFRFLDYEARSEPGVACHGGCRDAIEEMLQAVARGGDAAAWLSQTAQECNAMLQETAFGDD